MKSKLLPTIKPTTANEMNFKPVLKKHIKCHVVQHVRRYVTDNYAFFEIYFFLNETDMEINFILANTNTYYQELCQYL